MSTGQCIKVPYSSEKIVAGTGGCLLCPAAISHRISGMCQGTLLVYALVRLCNLAHCTVCVTS